MTHTHRAPATRRARRRNGLLLAVGLLALVAASAALLVAGLTSGAKAKDQPPARVFDIGAPAAVSAAEPPAITAPQPGSAYDSCDPIGGASLSIPSLCVNARLVEAGSRDGELEIPRDVRSVGLDRQTAPLASDRGTTVVAGHVDNDTQGQGALYALRGIEPGAEVSVTAQDGAVTKWRVYKVAEVRKAALPQDIFQTTGERRLVLVTCGGKLLRTSGGNTYEDNVLAYAVPAL